MQITRLCLWQAALEAEFWGVLDRWDTEATAKWALPVLGVGRMRVLHTVAASRSGPSWMEGLPDYELEDYKSLGIKQVRLGFQWGEQHRNNQKVPRPPLRFRAL